MNVNRFFSPRWIHLIFLLIHVMAMKEVCQLQLISVKWWLKIISVLRRDVQMSLKPCRKIVFVFCIHYENPKFSVVLDCLVFWSQSFVDNWVLTPFLWSTNTQNTTIRSFSSFIIEQFSEKATTTRDYDYFFLICTLTSCPKTI